MVPWNHPAGTAGTNPAAPALPSRRPCLLQRRQPLRSTMPVRRAASENETAGPSCGSDEIALRRIPATAAIRTRDDLEEMAVQILEIDAAPAVVAVDFALPTLA